MQREDIKMLVKKWWDIYNDESLDYKMPVEVADGEEVKMQPFLAALSEAGAVQYVTAPSAAQLAWASKDELDTKITQEVRNILEVRELIC